MIKTNKIKRAETRGEGEHVVLNIRFHLAPTTSEHRNSHRKIRKSSCLIVPVMAIYLIAPSDMCYLLETTAWKRDLGEAQENIKHLMSANA